MWIKEANDSLNEPKAEIKPQHGGEARPETNTPTIRCAALTSREALFFVFVLFGQTRGEDQKKMWFFLVQYKYWFKYFVELN